MTWDICFWGSDSFLTVVSSIAYRNVLLERGFFVHYDSKKGTVYWGFDGYRIIFLAGYPIKNWKTGRCSLRIIITIQLESALMSVWPSVCLYVSPSISYMHEVLPTYCHGNFKKLWLCLFVIRDFCCITTFLDIQPDNFNTQYQTRYWKCLDIRPNYIV